MCSDPFIGVPAAYIIQACAVYIDTVGISMRPEMQKRQWKLPRKE